MEEKRLIQKGGMIESVGKRMKELKNKNKELTKDLNDIIDKSTEKERKMIEDAEKAYNKKLSKVLEHPKVKEKMEKRWECNEDMSDLMSKILRAFRKATYEINRQTTINDDEKRKRIESLGNAITNAVLTSDEKKIMSAISGEIMKLPYTTHTISLL